MAADAVGGVKAALAGRSLASLFRRLASQAGRRLGWGVADQGVSSLTNYAVVLYIAHSLGAKQFGAFSLAYVTYGLALNASRGLATDSLLVRFSGTDFPTWRRAVARCTGTAAVVGLATGTCVLAAAFLLGGTIKLGFLALGLTLPGLLLQDSWRYSFFALGRGSQAFLNDMIWGVTLLVALALLRATHHADVFWCVFVWGATAGIAAAVGPLQARVVPRLSGAWEWMSRHRDLGFRYLAENSTNSAAVQLRAYGIGLILGLAAVGYVQAASTLMGPFMVIFFGLGLVTVPEAARVLRRSPRHLPLFCLLVGGGLAAAAFAWGIALLVALPRGLGGWLLGPIWRPTYPLVLPLMITLMGGCVSAGAGSGLHALAAARRSLRATIIQSGCTFTCSLVGAVAAGAVGVMYGSALAAWIGVLLFWWQLRMAMREAGHARARHRFSWDLRRLDRPEPTKEPTERLPAAAAAAGIDGTWGGIPPADELTLAAGLPPPDHATVMEPERTRHDPAEQELASAVYPQAGGRPETLADAPQLLRRYREAATADPLLYALVQTCIDWARCGFARPIPEPDLHALARDALAENRPDLGRHDGEVNEALRRACQPVAAGGGGQIAVLRCHQLADRTRAYDASHDLVAADDGQYERARRVTEDTWRRLLDRATDEEALGVGVAAYRRGNIPVAVAASHRAAEAGNTDAQFNLGVLLADRLNPPDLAQARTWWTRAAEAGNTDAQFNLGVLLADRLNPPDLAQARTWWTRAAEAGNTDAQFNLGVLLADRLNPPDLAQARTWWTRAAEAGNTDAQFNLGVLLADRLNLPDLAQARTWWTRAAEAGDTDAQFNLGVLLADRLDPPDLAQAEVWYTRAAEAGDTDAQFNLGVLLADRLDPPDLVHASPLW